jgi:molybdate transport system substrate-binding protein
VLFMTTASCGAPSKPRARELRVFAAASLTEAFTALGTRFERKHPGTTVVSHFNFGASSTLAQQINDGAPADVFASADEANMRKVTSTGNAHGALTFARNRLSLLVARGNPKHINGVADLAKPGVTFSLCAPAVPCGTLARAALARAGVDATPRSLEADVKAVVARVALGEIDAGIVYLTDARAGGPRVEGVPIDVANATELEAMYQIAVVTHTTNRAAAESWVRFVDSAEGRRALAGYGFRAP